MQPYMDMLLWFSRRCDRCGVVRRQRKRQKKVA